MCPAPARRYLSCGPSLAVIFRSEAQRGSWQVSAWEANRILWGREARQGPPCAGFHPGAVLLGERLLGAARGTAPSPQPKHCATFVLLLGGHRLSSHGRAALPRCPRCSTPAACCSAAGS